MTYANILKNCIAYIEDNLFDEIDLELLCKNIGYSKFHLSRLFNSKIGMSITNYINSRRLSEAALLLKKTEQPVIDIAFNCGYNSPDYFIKKFREKFNITPNNYRTGNDFIVITKKYNIKGDERMRFTDTESLVKYLFLNSKNKEDLTNIALKIDNCIISEINKSDVEIIAVIYPEDKLEDLQVIKISMITGKHSSQRIFKAMEEFVHIENLTKMDDEISFSFTSDKNPKKVINGNLISEKIGIKTSFTMIGE